MYVYVAPDGTHTILEPEADGNYQATSPTGKALRIDGGYMGPGMWTYMVWDFAEGGSIGLAPYALPPDDQPTTGVGPALMYEWTTTVPDVVPDGVDEDGLLGVHLSFLGFTLSVEARSYVPEGATIEQVTRWADGHEEVAPVVTDANPDAGEDPVLPWLSERDLTGLVSASLRVTGLPDGQSFEITSTYDPTKTWSAACGTTLNQGSSTQEANPLHFGPYFEGPESATFQCLAPLPARDEDVIPLTVETGTGSVDRSVDFRPEGPVPVHGDFGEGGALIDLSYDVYHYEDFPDFPALYPGWTGGWLDAPDGGYVGAAAFGGFAWVDADGVIIGRNVLNAEDETPGYFSVNLVSDLGYVDGRGRMFYVGKDLATSGVPCDGVDPDALKSASVVWVQGLGPDVDHMTWSWTRVGPATS